ncbi:unnamed protein product, partial [Schistosoma rodhaini]
MGITSQSAMIRKTNMVMVVYQKVSVCSPSFVWKVWKICMHLLKQDWKSLHFAVPSWYH